GTIDVEAIDPILAAHDNGSRQEWREMLAHGNRACPRTTAAMRPGECLVRIVVHQIDTHVARPNDAEYGVHIGPVEIELRASAAEHYRDLAYLGIKKAYGIRVGDHEDGRLVT